MEETKCKLSLSKRSLAQACMEIVGGAIELEELEREKERGIVIVGPAGSSVQARQMVAAIRSVESRYVGWGSLNQLSGYRPKPDIRSIDLLQTKSRRRKR